MADTQCYPLTFQPLLYEKVWGGRALERLAKPLAPGTRVGESWELADLAATSSSGAGGAAARSVIANGPLRGATLLDATAQWGRRMLGSARPAHDGSFPLLIKFLDARENLSVQVHPSPAYAHDHPEARLKTECWYILDAEPGALIYKGVKSGVTRDSFARHIADGSVVDDLIEVAAVPGTVHNLPSGTVHALGAGVLVAEVQTPSDTTFRVFDWGRAGRELHIEQALECVHFGPAPRGVRVPDGVRVSRITTTEFFTIDQLRLSCEEFALADSPEQVATGETRRGPCALIVLSGMGFVSSPAASFEDVPVRTGSTVLLPSDLLSPGPTGAVLRMGPASTILRVQIE